MKILNFWSWNLTISFEENKVSNDKVFNKTILKRWKILNIMHFVKDDDVASVRILWFTYIHMYLKWIKNNIDFKLTGIFYIYDLSYIRGTRKILLTFFERENFIFWKMLKHNFAYDHHTSNVAFILQGYILWKFCILSFAFKIATKPVRNHQILSFLLAEATRKAKFMSEQRLFKSRHFWNAKLLKPLSLNIQDFKSHISFRFYSSSKIFFFHLSEWRKKILFHL